MARITGAHEYYLNVRTMPGLPGLIGQFGPFATMVEAQRYERGIMARGEMAGMLVVVWQRVAEVPLLGPGPLTGETVPIVLAHGKVIPGEAVALFQEQTGLTREHLRWTCDLALKWEMVSQRQLDRWIDRVDVLGLDGLVPHVGAADIEDEEEYLGFMAER